MTELLSRLCSSIPLTGNVIYEILKRLILLKVFIKNGETHTSPELINVAVADEDCCAYLVGFKELKKQNRH